ncbi:MAG: TonB-dependent receptor family protein [Gemmatimonadales bacterium]
MQQTNLRLAIFVPGIAFTLAPLLHAQHAERDTLPPVTLEPVSVSVLRVPSALHLVPYDVSVGSDSLVSRARPRLSLGEALIGVPGVNVQNRFNYALGDRLSIRGFGSRTQFGIRGVKVLVDGIPATLADGQSTIDHLDLATVDRIEVLKGPASSLYGNASGGAIVFETGEPPAAPMEQEFGTVAGSDGLVRVESSTSVRQGRTSASLDLTRFLYDGYRQHSEADKTFSNFHLRYDGGRDVIHVVANFVDFDAQNPGSINDSLLRVDRNLANPFNVVQGTKKDARQGQLGVSWKRQTSTGQLDVSGYGLLRNLDNPIPVRVIELDRAAGGGRAQFTNTTLAGTVPLRWTIGLSTDWQRDGRKNFDNNGGDRGQLTLDQLETVVSVGAFVQLGVEVVDRVHILGGFRYDRVHFDANDHFTSGDPDDSGTRTMDAASPSVGLLFDVADQLSLYTNLATSFETPTTTELVNRPDGAGGFNDQLDPQRAFSFEFGFRGRVAGKANYQFAVYRTRVTDELIPFEVATQTGRTFFRNAGSAIHKGVELGGSVAPVYGLVLRAAYTYTDARFDDFATANNVFDGNQVPGVAPHRLELFGSYDSPLGWYVSGESEFASTMKVNDSNLASSPDYFLINARAGLRPLALGRWAIAPFVGISNFLDEDYNSAVTVNAFGGRFFEPGPGRTVYVGTKLKVSGTP